MFLPRDAMHKRGTAVDQCPSVRQSVRQSVSLSVTLMYCIETPTKVIRLFLGQEVSSF